MGLFTYSSQNLPILLYFYFQDKNCGKASTHSSIIQNGCINCKKEKQINMGILIKD